MLPDAETSNAFLYCLAASAKRSGVQVIFFLAMSNHYHAGVFDPEGRLPEFLEYFHKLFAKHQNALRGRWENFWSAEQTSVVALRDAEAVLTAMVYTLTNPVKASLVALAHEWPGATSFGAQVNGTSLRVPRPSRYFRPDGPMLDEETLTVSLPPFMRDGCPDEFRRELNERIAFVEEREAALRKQEGRKVMGVRALLRQRWSDCPNTGAPRRQMKRFACHQAKAQYRAFLAAYQEARKCVLGGLKAIFPAGTYWLRRFAGQPCEPLPESS
jgi:putative transposase